MSNQSATASASCASTTDRDTGSISCGTDVVILLCGGDKRTQERDIIRAKTLAAED